MKTGFEEIPDKWLRVISDHLKTFNNDTSFFSNFHIRNSLQYVYPAVIFFYIVVIFLGTGSNSAMMVFIYRFRLYRNSTILLLSNLAISNLITCLIVLPLSLINILLDKWVFGKFMCFFLPMLQDFPFLLSSLTFLVIAIDRFHFIVRPSKTCVRVYVFLTLLWIISIAAVMPYILYMIYFDLQSYFGKDYKGSVICAINFESGINSYIRGTFVVFYITPLLMAILLHFRVTLKIKKIISCQENQEQISFINRVVETSFSDASSVISHPPQPTNEERSQQLHLFDTNFHPVREKRAQKYLAIMTILFLLYPCPLKILQLLKYVAYGTYDISHQFDITYTTLFLLTFIPTCTTPALFGSWALKMPFMDRINSYFWLNKRGLSTDQEASSFQVTE